MIRKKPRVSVLIPAFNYASYIAEAIESVLSQTFTDFEIIVIDNNSSDNTVAIVSNYVKKDKRVRLICNSENIGMTPNWNRSLLYTQGEYIKFLNADDCLLPNNLKYFVDILQKEQSISLVTSWRKNIGLNHDLVVPPHRYKVSGLQVIEETMSAYRNWIGEPSSVMFRKSDIPIGGFNTQLHWLPDWDMWLRLLLVGDLYIVPEVLSQVRIHDKQATVSLKKSFFTIFEEYRYYRSVLHDNTIFTLKESRKILKFMALQISLHIVDFMKTKEYTLAYKAVKIAFKERVVMRMLYTLIQADSVSDSQSCTEDAFVNFLLKEIAHNQQQQIVLYGFNNVCERVYEKCFEKNEIIAIVDASKYGYQFHTMKISQFDNLKLHKNITFVITAMNKTYIQEIQQVILEKFPMNTIISL